MPDKDADYTFSWVLVSVYPDKFTIYQRFTAENALTFTQAGVSATIVREY